jgi:hypothetical protein
MSTLLSVLAFLVYHATNYGLVYAIPLCYFALRYILRCQSTNFLNHNIRYFPLWASRPALPSLVLGIICGCTKKQMSRIAARWIVAVVAHMKIVRDRPMGQHVAIAMGVYLRAINFYYAVASGGRHFSPFPALTSVPPMAGLLVDPGPETLFYWWASAALRIARITPTFVMTDTPTSSRGGIEAFIDGACGTIGRHRKSPLRCSATGRYSGSVALLCPNYNI